MGSDLLVSSHTIRVDADVAERLMELRRPTERSFSPAIRRALDAYAAAERLRARVWGGAAPAGKLVADYEQEHAG